MIASIESALGFMNIKEIVTADPRLDALIVSIFFVLMNKHLTYPLFSQFAAEDYCADVGLTRTPSRKEMLFARQYLVNAAAAYGLQAIDLVSDDYV